MGNMFKAKHERQAIERKEDGVDQAVYDKSPEKARDDQVERDFKKRDYAFNKTLDEETKQL